jgi:hypothetical protein
MMGVAGVGIDGFVWVCVGRLLRVFSWSEMYHSKRNATFIFGHRFFLSFFRIKLASLVRSLTDGQI